jgi:hypothetical protein
MAVSIHHMDHRMRIRKADGWSIMAAAGSAFPKGDGYGRLSRTIGMEQARTEFRETVFHEFHRQGLPSATDDAEMAIHTVYVVFRKEFPEHCRDKMQIAYIMLAYKVCDLAR